MKGVCAYACMAEFPGIWCVSLIIAGGGGQ